MELLDILDEDMKVIGVEDRKIVHEKGLWHIHVGIWLMNEEGKILFQKRAATKKVNPNKWSRTGGHVASGETPLIGIQREVKEEIGIEILEEKIELIDIDKVRIDKYNNHFVYNYFAYVNCKIEDYKMQKEEVVDLKYISIEEMKDIKRNNNENYTFITWDNFDKTIELLSQKSMKI